MSAPARMKLDRDLVLDDGRIMVSRMIPARLYEVNVARRKSLKKRPDGRQYPDRWPARA